MIRNITITRKLVDIIVKTSTPRQRFNFSQQLLKFVVYIVDSFVQVASNGYRRLFWGDRSCYQSFIDELRFSTFFAFPTKSFDCFSVAEWSTNLIYLLAWSHLCQL